MKKNIKNHNDNITMESSSSTTSPKFKTTFEERSQKDYCDPSKRMDFVFFFEVIQGNPNGDPDAGNLPRVDPTDDHGIVTDVSTKRKIRNYLQTAHDRPIFIQSQTALNKLYFDTARALRPEGDDKNAVESVFAEISKKHLDSSKRELKKNAEEFLKLITEQSSTNEGDQQENLSLDDNGIEKQTFAEWLATLSDQGLDTLEYDPDEQRIVYSGDAKNANDIKKEIEQYSIPSEHAKKLTELCKILGRTARGGGSRRGKELVKMEMAAKFDDIRLFGAVLTAGTNAGQIRGPIQLTFARSEDPIVPIESSITRCAITKASDFLKKETEMGRKPWISWALYRQCGFYNAPLGAAPEKGGTGVTREDLARFWESFAHMFADAKSASNGRIQVRELIVFVHDDPSGRGNAPFHLLEKKINLKKKSGLNEFTKGFEEVYEPITVDSIKKEAGITVHFPLKDLWTEI